MCHSSSASNEAFTGTGSVARFTKWLRNLFDDFNQNSMQKGTENNSFLTDTTTSSGAQRYKAEPTLQATRSQVRFQLALIGFFHFT
jgi:hypothetical protein